MNKMLLKIFLFSLLFAGHSAITIGQQHAAKFELKENLNKETFSFDDGYQHTVVPVPMEDSGKVTILYATSGLLIAKVLNENLEESKSFSADIPESKILNHLIGAFRKDSTTIAAIYTDKKNNNFSVFEVDLKNNEINPTDFSFLVKGEKVLHCFPIENGFKILSVVNRTSKLKLYKIFVSLRGNISLSKHSYDFSEMDLDKTLPNISRELIDYTVKGNEKFARTSSKIKSDFSNATSNFKIYEKENSLILTMDHVFGRTSIFKLFFDSKEKDYQLFEFPANIRKRPFDYSVNSYISGDTLFQGAISDDQLIVNYLNITTEESIMEIEFNKEQLDSMSGNYIYRDELLGENKKLSNIYKDILKNQLAILPVKSESGIQLRIGSYNRMLKNDLISSNNQLLQFKLSESQVVSSFHLKFDDQGELIPYDRYRLTLFDKIKTFKSDTPIKFPMIETIFSINEKSYYGWYNTNQSKFVIKLINHSR